MKEAKLVVSTDCAGLFATPKDWEYQWGFLKSYKNFAGFELLPWGSRLFPSWPKGHMKKAQEMGYKVVGIHGRVGKDRRPGIRTPLKSQVMNQIYNEMMISTEQLLSDLASNVEYVLLHNTELRAKESEKLIDKYKNNIKCLQIENAYDGNDVEEVLKFAKFYKAKGINVGITFDLYHYLHMLEKEGHKNLIERWERTLVQLEELLKIANKEGYSFELHFPVGMALDDSLPPEIGFEEWRRVAKLVKGKVDYITIESHPFRNDFLFPTRESKLKNLIWNKNNIEQMKKAGLI